jgi:hypothetical protein
MDAFQKDRAAVSWIAGAWDDYVDGLPVLLPVLIAAAAASAPAMWLLQKYHSMLPAAVYMLLVLMPLEIGINLVYIRIARGEKASLKDMFSAFPLYHRAIAAGAALGLLTLGGAIAFVIPGVVLYLTYGFALYALVDRRCGVREAFSVSRLIVEGWRTRLLFLLTLTIAVNFFTPEAVYVSGPLKAPELAFNLKPWVLVSTVLKTFVFVPWLELAMARAYVYLLAPRPLPEPSPEEEE